MVGTKPSWMTISATGIVSGTPDAVAAQTTVTFKVAEPGSATNFANKAVSFPAVDGGGGSNVSWFATVTDKPTTLTKDSAIFI